MKINKKRGQNTAFLFLAIAVVIFGIFLVKTEMTGMIVAGETLNYMQSPNLVLNESHTTNFTLERTPKLFVLNSFSLSGSVIGNGTARVFLKYNNKKYLVLDTSLLNQNKPSITGYAAIPQNISNVTNQTSSNKIINQTLGINQTINQTTALIINKTTLPARSQSLKKISKNKTLKTTSFNDICIETCILPQAPNKTSYQLIIEINNTLLNLSKISYSLQNLTSKEKLAKVDRNVLKKLEEVNETKVIVLLKKPKLSRLSKKLLSKKEKIKIKKIKIKKIQKTVLSKLNKTDFKARHQYQLFNAFSGKVTKAGLRELRKNPNVLRIYEDRVYNISLNESVPLINADDVWQKQVNGINITGKGQTVCIVDTGIDYNHTDLGAGWGNKVKGGYRSLDAGLDVQDCSINHTACFDDEGHGTHVAGIISSTNSIYTGVAPDSDLVVTKVLDSTGSGYASDIVAGVEWCVNNSNIYNISVISMSLGDRGSYNSSTCPTYIDSLVNSAVDLGIAVVAASGNDGYNTGISHPACSPNVISVGAVDKSDALWYWTDTGDLLDVLAPGVDITSTKLAGGFISYTGTSMATPHVAGAAALLQQYSKLYANKNIMPSEIRDLLKKDGILKTDSDNGLSFPRIDVLATANSILKTNDADYSAENDYGKVRFLTPTNLTNVSRAFTILPNLISLPSIEYPEFNKSAALTIFNLTFEKPPVVLKNGIVCSAPLCNVTNYDGNFTFNVAGFTNYTAGANSQLEIWDSADSDMPYYEGVARVGNNISFYANYTNITSGAANSNATCNITFSDSSALMTFNATKNIFEYNRTFNLTGFKTYNITCKDTNFETLSLTDTIEVLTNDINCTFPGANIDWIINGTQTVACVGENLIFDNQSILIRDNASLLLIDTNLTMKVNNTILRINVSENANFTAENSILDCEATASNCIVQVYGHSNLYNVVLNKSYFYAYSNSVSNITSSFLSLGGQYSYFQDNSTNYITNTTFGTTVYFRDTSNNIIQNSIFNGAVYPSDTAVLNFTLPQSNLTNSIGVSFSAPTIYGYVDMPSTITILSSTISRYYPIRVVYTNADIGVANKPANITYNPTGDLVWNGTTDSEGWVEANLTLNSTNYGDGNFTLSVNPVSNISLLTNTPITVLIADTTPPSWSGNETTPASNSAYSPGQQYTFKINWTDNVAVDDVLFEYNFTGTPTNSPPSDITGNTYYFFYSPLAAGTYYWKSYANDTSGNLNTTDSFTYIVAKATSTCSLTFDKTSPQNYTTQINASCSCTNPEASAKLYRNGTDVTATENNQLITLPAGTWNYICNVTETQNYTSASTISPFTINKADPSPYLNLSLNGNESNLLITYGAISNATGLSALADNQDLIFNLYRNNTIVSSGDPASEITTLAAGSYSYVYNTTGGANYTAGSSSVRILTVNKASTYVNLSLNGNETNLSLTYPETVNATYSTNALTAAMYRNGTEVSGENNTPITLGVGYYNYTVINPGNENYTSSSKTFFVNVTQAITNLTLSASPSWNETYGTATNISCAANNAEVNISLYRNNVLVNIPDIAVLGAGTYVYVCNNSATQNYSNSSESNILTINKAESIINLTLNNQDSNITINQSSSAQINAALIMPSSGYIELYINGSLIDAGSSPLNNTSIFNTLGEFNITALYPSTENYSSAYETHFVIVKDKTNPSIQFVDPTTKSGNYSQSWIAANVTTADINLDVMTVRLYNSTAIVNSTPSSNSLIFINFTNLKDNTYYLNATANDTTGNINSTETRKIILDTTPPSLITYSPKDNAIDGDGNIYFNCTAEDNFNLENISLYLEGNLNKTSNISGTDAAANFTLLNLSNGNYSWYCEAYDSSGNKNTSETRIVQVNKEAVPIYNNFSGNTTNWAALPDLSNVCNSTAMLDNPDTDMVTWHGCVDAVGQDFDTAVKLSYNNVTIIGLNPSFNSSATLHIRNLKWEYAPDIYVDGKYCNASICSNVSYVNGTAVFNVTHFTSFATIGNAKLMIWDETDENMPYANQTKYLDEQIKFFANYTRSNNGNSISNAICLINFANQNGTMIFNATTEIYEYNRSFAENGTFNYNITCDSAGTELINLTDNVTVNPKLISLINLTLDKQDTNITTEINSEVSMTATLIEPSGDYIEMYQNGIKIINGSSPLTLNKTYNELGLYNITATYNGSRNYTASHETHFITIQDTQNPSVTNLTADPAVINQTQTTNITATVSDNAAISKVIVNITRADNVTESYEMLESNNNLYYYEYVPAGQNKAGRYYAKIIANDTSNNINNTEQINFTVLDTTNPKAIIIEPIENTVYDYDSDVSIKINATDETQIDAVLANISWDGNNKIQKLEYNSSSLFYEAIFNETSIMTDYNITIMANDTANNVNNTEKTIFEITDISPPTWSNIKTDPASPAIYDINQSYTFYATWTDNIKVNSVLFEFNGKNNTVTTRSGDEYYYTLANLSAGTYEYRWYANDVYNNWNNTPLLNYTINKANSSINLTIDSVAANKTIEINTAATIKAETITPPSGYLVLYQDGILINNGTFSLQNTTIYGELGTHNITSFYNSTQNYSASSKTLFITVQDTESPSVTNITTNPGVINQTQTTNITAIVTDDTSVTVKLNITKPNNITTTYGMIKGSGDLWYYEYTPTNQDPAGRYYLKIIANDSSNNINNTEIDFFDVNDINVPIVNIASPSENATYEYGDAVIIKANASDETELDSILANITQNMQSELLTLMYNSSSSLYENSFTNTAHLGRYNITLIVNDTSGNINDTETTYFNIFDLSAPAYSNIRTDPYSYSPINETFFTFYANWVDNINLSKVILEFNNQNYTVTTRSGDEYYYTLANLSAGTYEYRWYANDTSNNLNSTEYYDYVVVAETVPPNITSFSVYPAAVVTGDNVTLNMAAVDNANISTMWAVITLPNSSTSTITTFPSDFTTTINGRYNVTFYANDTSYNIANATEYFLSNIGFNLTLYVQDHNGTGVNTDLIIYLAGTNKEVNASEFTGNLNNILPVFNYDLLFTAYNRTITARLNNINLTKYNNKTFGLDKRTQPIDDYLMTYAVTSKFNQSNITLTFDYTNTGFTNEDYISLYKCADWNFTQQTCYGTWQNLAVIQDKTANTLTAALTDLSGFSIKQESYCGDKTCNSGENIDNCPLDCTATASSDGSRNIISCSARWNCTDWSECTKNETQTRTCISAGTCKMGNKTEIQKCNYTSQIIKEEITIETPKLIKPFITIKEHAILIFTSISAAILRYLLIILISIAMLSSSIAIAIEVKKHKKEIAETGKTIMQIPETTAKQLEKTIGEKIVEPVAKDINVINRLIKKDMEKLANALQVFNSKVKGLPKKTKSKIEKDIEILERIAHNLIIKGKRVWVRDKKIIEKGIDRIAYAAEAEIKKDIETIDSGLKKLETKIKILPAGIKEEQEKAKVILYTIMGRLKEKETELNEKTKEGFKELKNLRLEIAKEKILARKNKEFVVSLAVIKKKEEAEIKVLEEEISQLEKDLRELEERKKTAEITEQQIRELQIRELQLKDKETQISEIVKKDINVSKTIQTRIKFVSDLVADYKSHIKKLEESKNKKEISMSIIDEKISLLEVSSEKIAKQKQGTAKVKAELEKDNAQFQIKKQELVKLINRLYKKREFQFARFKNAGVAVPAALEKRINPALKELERKLENLDLNIKLIANKVRKLENKERILELRERSKISFLNKEKYELDAAQKEYEKIKQKINSSVKGVIENTKLLEKLERSFIDTKEDLLKKKKGIKELEEKESMIKRRLGKLASTKTFSFKEKIEQAILSKKKSELKDLKTAVQNVNKIESETIKKFKDRIGRINDYKEERKEIKENIKTKSKIINKIKEKKKKIIKKEAKEFAKDILKNIKEADEKTKNQIKKTKEYKQNMLNKLKEVYG